MNLNKRKSILICIDMAVILIISILTALILPEFSSFAVRNELIALKIAFNTVFLLGSRFAIGVYRSIWRYADAYSYIRLIFSDIIASLLMFTLGRLIPNINPGAAYIAITNSFVLLATLSSRFAYQIIYAKRNSHKEASSTSYAKIKKVAIVGAGNVGSALSAELQRNPRSNYIPYCFIDTDKNKIGNSINGVVVYPENERILNHLKSGVVDEIVIALPDADSEHKTEIYEKYRKIGLPIMTYDYPVGSISNTDKRSLREFKIEDLLFRESIKLDKNRARSYYRDKVILVTGGGGSIGSELCRQIAKCSPSKLIIVDIYENNAYEIQQELIRKYDRELDLDVIIASVRDRDRIEQIFSLYRPQVVFHAAAHKHVPLMEDSPMEAIKNNVFGTKNVADMAENYGCEKFVLISTDKAVNPTNIMGASKRLCEMIIQCRTDNPTAFTAVRFGNVLGSNGSVIPLFKRQIESGGPVTLTDKRIIRYFMTISEAVALVMEAGVFAEDGELFVLDMGKPVKILDLAEKLIQLSGFEPYKDIDIQEIGLRPGEKLYEELLIKNEGAELGKTENELIFIEHDKAKTREEVNAMLLELRQAADANDIAEAFAAIRDTVPTYHTK